MLGLAEDFLSFVLLVLMLCEVLLPWGVRGSGLFSIVLAFFGR